MILHIRLPIDTKCQLTEPTDFSCHRAKDFGELYSFKRSNRYNSAERPRSPRAEQFSCYGEHASKMVHFHFLEGLNIFPFKQLHFLRRLLRYQHIFWPNIIFSGVKLE